MSALAGGFTSVVMSSNTHPPIDSPALVQFVQQKAARANLAKLYPLGCVSKERQGEELAEIGSLVEAGVVALSDAPRAIENTALMRRSRILLDVRSPVTRSPRSSSTLARRGNA